jgi:hypothetical protein
VYRDNLPEIFFYSFPNSQQFQSQDEVEEKGRGKLFR